MAGFELSVPADPVWSGLAKALTAAGTAPMDLDIDRIEDLFILLDEMITEAVDAPGTSTLKLRLALEEDLLRLRLTTDGTSDIEPRSPFADTVLATLAEEHHQEDSAEGRAIEVSFRARTTR